MLVAPLEGLFRSADPCYLGSLPLLFSQNEVLPLAKKLAQAPRATPIRIGDLRLKFSSWDAPQTYLGQVNVVAAPLPSAPTALAAA